MLKPTPRPVAPVSPSGRGRGTSGPSGGRATVGGMFTIAGLGLTAIVLVQTKVAFDQAFKEVERQNSQKPLEDEAMRQAGAWGLGIGVGIGFGIAVKAAVTGGLIGGPAGMAIGFFGGMVAGAAASYFGGMAAQAGIGSGAVDPLRVIFQPTQQEPNQWVDYVYWP